MFLHKLTLMIMLVFYTTLLHAQTSPSDPTIAQLNNDMNNAFSVLTRERADAQELRDQQLLYLVNSKQSCKVWKEVDKIGTIGQILEYQLLQYCANSFVIRHTVVNKIDKLSVSYYFVNGAITVIRATKDNGKLTYIKQETIAADMSDNDNKHSTVLQSIGGSDKLLDLYTNLSTKPFHTIDPQLFTEKEIVITYEQSKKAANKKYTVEVERITKLLVNHLSKI